MNARLWNGILLGFLFAISAAAAGEKNGASAPEASIFVDPQLTEAETAAYDPATRKSGGGKSRAFKTLKAACEAAGAGMTVSLRGGTYAEQLVPKNSGEEGKYITFRNYEKEEAVISPKFQDLSSAVMLNDRHHIALEGLKVAQVRRWLLACKVHHILLKGNTFLQATDPGGSSKTGLFFEEAHHVRILGNVMHDTTMDNLMLIKSDRNLIEGNIFTKGTHNSWTIQGCNFTVIRGNYSHNELEKIGSVLDCEKVGSSHQFTEFNCTKHNLIERNVFAYTCPRWYDAHHLPFHGIQYAAQEGIIRHNLFYSLAGGAGISMSLYSDEAKFNTDNRIYNNVFYKCNYGAVAIPKNGAGLFFSGNVFKNNILYQNSFVRREPRWEWEKQLDGKPVQVWLNGMEGFVFERNILFNEKPGESYLVIFGSRNSAKNPPPLDVSWRKADATKGFVDNLDCDPQFAAPEQRDFRLKPGSPALDAGGFLTRTKNAGEGTTLAVEDVRWFCDGFEIEGLLGDEIQLEGQTQAVRITKADYEKHILTLAAPLKWTAGQGVALAYAGKAPDVGAYESGLPEPPAAPPAPAGLKSEVPPGIELGDPRLPPASGGKK